MGPPDSPDAADPDSVPEVSHRIESKNVVLPGQGARWPIAFFATAAIVTLVVLTAQQLSHERTIVESALKNESRARVLSFEQHVLRTLTVAEVALQDVVDETAQGQEWLYDPADLDDRLINLPIFDAVIVEIPGKPVVSTNADLKLSTDVLQDFKRIAASAGQRPIVTQPVLTDRGKKVGVLRRLNIPSGGYVVILLEPRRFTDFADHINFGENDLISLIGLDGVTRARRTGRRFSTGETVRGLVMERQMAAPNGDYVGPSVLDGIPRFFSHQRLSRYALFATSGIPTATVEARTSLRKHLHISVMAAAILAVLLAAHVIQFVFRRNQRRMRDLVQAIARLNEAQRIGSMGDWDYYPSTDRLHWSHNLRRMYHRPNDIEVTGISDVAQYVSAEDLNKIERAVSDVMTTGKPTQWEVTATLSDGSESHRRVVAAPIFDERQNVIGIHGTDQDVTSEVRVRQMEQRIGELARLDSMSAFAATLAHELNQPLAIAANYLAAAARNLTSTGHDTKTKNYLSSAQEQIDHLAQIIVGARELVDHSETKTEAVDLTSIIRETIQLLRDAVSSAPFSTRLSIAEDARTVLMNRAQLKQVLFNLGRNSIEATPEDQKPHLTFVSRRLNDTTVQVELHDRGAGFEKNQDDPFAAMATSKDTGMGLGLSLARTIVEFHGGKIWVERFGPDGAIVAFTVQAQPVSDDMVGTSKS